MKSLYLGEYIAKSEAVILDDESVKIFMAQLFEDSLVEIGSIHVKKLELMYSGESGYDA